MSKQKKPVHRVQMKEGKQALNNLMPFMERIRMR